VAGLSVPDATPTDGPASSAAAQTVAGIRELPVDVLVTGGAAHLADYRQMLASNGPWLG
jgi:hypothetical protein